MDLEERLKEIVREVFREELQSLTLDDRLLTAEQVADMLGYADIHSVYRLKREGKLSPVKLGEKSVRYRNSDVQRLIRDLAA